MQLLLGHYKDFLKGGLMVAMTEARDVILLNYPHLNGCPDWAGACWTPRQLFIRTKQRPKNAKELQSHELQPPKWKVVCILNANHVTTDQSPPVLSAPAFRSFTPRKWSVYSGPNSSAVKVPYAKSSRDYVIANEFPNLGRGDSTHSVTSPTTWASMLRIRRNVYPLGTWQLSKLMILSCAIIFFFPPL